MFLMDNKYIVIKDEFSNDVPILFPPSVKHIDIGHRQICVSAGFYRLSADGEVEVFGRSDSLKLETRSIDARYIKRLVVSKRGANDGEFGLP
mgnify:CR=1 FL=1